MPKNNVLPGMRTITMKAPVMSIEGRLLSESVDDKTRTVDFVFATENKVRMFNWDIGFFNEILSMDPAHVRRGRLDKGRMPLLDSHARWSLRDQLGKVVSGEFVDKEFRGKVKFSKREDVEPVFQDVKDDVVSSGSLGYKVYEYQELTMPGDKIRTLKAIDWEPTEFSLTPVGADEDAGRSERGDGRQEFHEVKIVVLEEQTQCGNRADQPKGEDMPKQPDAVPTQEPANPVDADAIRKDAGQAAQIRVKEIREAVRAAKLGQEFEDELIDSSRSADECRKLIFTELKKRDDAANTRSQTDVTVTSANEDARRQGMTEAILFRARALDKVSDKGRGFQHMKLLDMAREFAGRGFNMSPNDVVQRALSTSDFPAILVDAINRGVQREYAEKPQSFEPFVRRVPLGDFKSKHTLKLGDFPELKKKNELGEIQEGAISEGKESYKLDSYARSVVISREAIINDDMDVFGRLPQMAGRRARSKESDLVWAIINSNPTMADTFKLFATEHANISAGAAPSIDEIGKLVKLMRLQQGLDGEMISIQPAWLIVPAAYETKAGQLLDTKYVPATKAEINPWSSILKGYITDPRLDAASATKWYLAADKADIDMIELGTLDGQGPQVNLEEKFGTGVKVAILHDVGAGLIDHRGFAGNGTFS